MGKIVQITPDTYDGFGAVTITCNAQVLMPVPPSLSSLAVV